MMTRAAVTTSVSILLAAGLVLGGMDRGCCDKRVFGASPAWSGTVESAKTSGSLAIVTGSNQALPDSAALDAAFEGAQVVDLRTSTVPSVVILREKIRIPPPSQPVLVKVFKRENLPAVLRPAFSREGVTGVTILGRYVAILQTDFQKEFEDVLAHELVHAYVTLASPKPLPFWFQEAGAVLFSTGKARKFYGRPSRTEVGVTEGRIVSLDPTYKQKLQSFNYLIDRVGKERFYQWYRRSVLTGLVDASSLLREKIPVREASSGTRAVPVWLWVAGGLVVMVVAVIGFYAARREPEAH